jgi:hypothetical protein
VGGAYGSAAELRQKRDLGFRMLAFTDYLLLAGAAKSSLAELQPK